MRRPPRLSSAGSFVPIFILLFFVPFSSSDQCITGCHGMGSSGGYLPGHTYIYEFEGKSVTSVSETNGDSAVKLNALVELAVKPDCIHQLSLKNVRVNGAPAPLKDVEQHALQFNYHDGHIDTSICAEPGDSQASLNVKRAVASMFQSAVMQENGVTSHRETDIFGSCQTDFEFRKEGDSLIVRKQRNLGRCSHRESMSHALMHATYDETSDIKSSPVLDSHQKVEQVFKKGVLNSAKSTETYNYRPFSNGDAGAKTTVYSTLTLKTDKADASANAPVSMPKSLVFDPPHPVTDSSSADAITKAVKAVKHESDPETVKDEAAEKFGELVKTLRKSNKNHILSVYRKIKAGAEGFDKNSDSKILLDALYRTGTGEAAEVVVELIKNKEISGLQLLAFYASLALIDHVNLSAVTSVTSLLDRPDVPRLGYLGIGRVIGKYCQQHECENVPEIKAAIGKIAAKVGNGKPGNRDQENIAIAALKGLRNANYLDDETIDKLVNIVKDKSVHDRVRVAAIEAFTAKCTSKWKKPMIDVFGDKEEDSEIRIKTYLSLVECICPNSANSIKEKLDQETVYQVGSFVQSHLRNLRASTDPTKYNAKKLLGEVRPRTKFPEDFRKYSFNRELSYNIDTLGIGSVAEQNVIYSQKSFVPRSVSLNLTAEIFGRSFNFLELDARLENVDRVIEHYFGPKGVFRKNELKDLIAEGDKNMKDMYERLKERIGKTGRGRRSAINEADLEKFAKSAKPRESEIDGDMDIDLSIRMFGVELVYIDLQEKKFDRNPDSAMDKIFGFIDRAFDKAKDFDYNQANHMHFMDFDLLYPTGLGFPLSVGIEGNAVTHIKANGKLDIPAIIKDPNHAMIKIGLEPSASIAIVHTLSIETFGTKSGLRVVRRMHTSTGSELSIKALNGKGFDVNFGIPKKKQEIISVSTDIIFVDAKGNPSKPTYPTSGKAHSDCFEQFSSILGVTVCGHFSYPYDSIESLQKRPLFPLSGPSKFAVSVENNDVTSYHLRALLDTSKEDEKTFELLFDTPNSRTNRKIAVNVDVVNKPAEKFIKAKLDSPFKKVIGEVSLHNTDKKKALAVTLTHDNDEYYATVGLVADGSKYKPILEYKFPEHIERLAGGKGGKSGSAAYKMVGDIDVNDQDGGKKYSFNKVSLMASDKQLLSLDGFVVAKPDSLVVDAAVSHNDENLKIAFDGKRMASGFDVKMSAVPSKDPNIGFKLMWNIEKAAESIEQNFVFIYGPDLASTVNRLTIAEKLEYKKNEHPTHPYAYFNSIKAKSEITFPAQEIAMKFEHELSPVLIDSEVDIKYGKFKTGSEFEVKMEEGAPHNWEVEWEAYIMDSKLSVGAKHKKLSDHKRKFEGKFEFPGSKYEIDTTIDSQLDPHRKYIQFDGDLKINGKSLKVNYDLDANPQQIKSDAVISLNNAKYFEFILRLQCGNNPNGKLNLEMKNIVIVNGNFNYLNGKGDALIDVDFPKLDRKMKGTGDLTVTGSRHVGNVEILFNAGKDPSKRIKLSTDSDVEKNAIDSKNIIDIFTYKFELNGKGNVKEKKPGELDYEGEGDLTLPNGRYITAKGKQSVGRKSEKTELHGQYEVSEHAKKGDPGRTLAYNCDVTVMEPKQNNFNGQHALKFVNIDGKDLQLGFGYKHEDDPKKPEQKTGELKMSANGAYMPRPFKFDFDIDYWEDSHTHHDYSHPLGVGNWKLDTSLGSDLSVKGKGSLDHGTDTKPLTGESEFILVLPSEKLRNLKYKEKMVLKTFTVHGQRLFQYDFELTYNDDKTIKGSMETQATGWETGKVKEGSTKLSMSVLTYPPLSLESSHKYDPTAEMRKGVGTLAVGYGNKKVTGEVEAAYLPDLSQINVKAKAATPMEKIHSIEVGLDHKHEKDGPWKNDVYLVADDKKYEMKSELVMNPSLYHADIVLMCPNGKTSLLAKVSKLSNTEYKGEWKIDSPQGFAAADGHVKMDSVDNFMMEMNFDSDKFKYRNIHAEITTGPAVKTGKRITLTVTSDGKNIITGSTNYNKRDEAGKIIVEGNGSLKIGENTRSSKFTYSRKQLTRENDGELGVAILLNANFGPSAVVGELKLTDKEVLVFNSYCEQSKDCAHFKLQSNVNSNQKVPIDHQITVEVDLKKFNLPVEFGLIINTKYQVKEMNFEHAAYLYLHTSKDKTQYSSQIYMRPKESAVILTLPSRELAIIAAADVPKAKSPIGPYKIDISVYLDRKNHPNDKTSFIANGDISVEKNAISMHGESKFIYPTQAKDMVIKGKLLHDSDNLLDANIDIDIFAKKSQKITIATRLLKNNIPKGYNITGDVEISSRGQQLKVDMNQFLTLSASDIGFGSMMSYTDINQKPKNMGVSFTLNVHEAHFLLQAPNKDLIRADTTMSIAKNAQKVNTEIKFLDNSPIIVSLEANDFNRFKYQSYQKDKPDTKLVIEGHMVIGQVAELHADFFKAGEKKNLYNLGVYLDESRFLKPTLAYNKDNVAYLIDFYREISIKRLEQLREIAKIMADEAATEFKDLFDHLKKATPNWKPALDYYEAELEKLKQELNADTTIKEIQAAINKVFGRFVEAVTEVFSQLSKRMMELHKQLNEISEKIVAAIQATYPKLKESFDKVSHAAIEITDAASKLVATYVKALLDILNQHQKEIKELITVISELLHDIAKIFLKGFNEIDNEVKKFVKQLVEQIQALPIYDFIKQKYQELSNFRIPDTILMPIEETFTQLKRVLPTEELRQFFTVTNNYIMKLLRHQKVDSGAEIKNIYSHLVDAIHSIIELLRNRGGSEQLYGLFDVKLPSGFGYLKDLPGVPILRVSVINLLKNNELPSIADIYYAYRPTRYTSDIVPPFSKIGIVVEGGHFFTFDGRHLTMAGTCDYVLAQDTRDGNFSVVSTFNSGKLISITVTAPGESITLKSNGNILVNNKAAEYPASTDNLHAFLTPPIVNVKSDYGLHVACSHKSPMICSVRVSGFYHGRLRGLFGDANNEPYDDFTLPSGHITTKEDEFGNAYRLNPSCAVAPAVDHNNHQRNPTCTQYFTAGSSMSPCFNYVNPANFRTACDHATSAGTQRASCLISAAYVATCRYNRVFISIPSACASCKLGKDEVSIGDSFSVKIPKKEADVVFVVEQDARNEKVFKELITPVISELKNELAHHGISDVHVGLIGYAENMKWPQHYTTGGSMNIEGDVKNINFSPSTPLISFKEAKESDMKTRLQFAKQRLDVELGTFRLTDAYEEAIRYPFRPGAVKSVVGIIANPCEKTPLPLSLQHLRLFLGQKVYRDLGLTYYHVGYLNDILVSGKPQKNIVGYDDESGYTFGDSKKKPLEGSIDKNNIALSNNDVCAGFAVSSGGAAFSSNHFMEAKPNQKKQFIQVMARRLADGMTNVELNEDCKCQQQYGLDGHANCKIVGRKEKETKQSKGA